MIPALPKRRAEGSAIPQPVVVNSKPLHPVYTFPVTPSVKGSQKRTVSSGVCQTIPVSSVSTRRFVSTQARSASGALS